MVADPARSAWLLDARVRELGVDALLLHDPADIRWACGFTGSNALLLWTPDRRLFVTDGRYATQASAEVRDVEVHVPGYDLSGFLGESGAFDAIARAAFSSDSLTVAMLDRLCSVAPSVSWTPVDGVLSAARASKTAAEIGAIRRAQHMAEHVLDEVAGIVREGMSERELAAEITYRLLRQGAERTAFEPIVASGERSALPHARPSDRVLRAGDPVLLDFGGVVDGYCSDMTRMLSMGPPSAELRRVHDVVARAVRAGTQAVRAGVAASAVDAAARGVVETEGLGPRFPHSLGHGVGLDVHEAPTVSWRSDAPLPPDAVVTVEPGVYLAGRFGVRIEDLVHVTGEGGVTLTRVPHDLIIV